MSVDVIHTSINYLGMDEVLGDRDYYVNFCNNQHSCSWWKVGCDHLAAYRIYVDALRNPSRFQGRRCRTAHEIIKGICEEEGPTVAMLDRGVEAGTYLILDNQRIK